MAYEWVVNKAKFSQAKLALEQQKLLNPSLVITEEMIKNEYVKRAGLLIEDKPEIEVDPLTKAVKVVRKDPKDKEIANLKAELAVKKAKKEDKE